MCHIYDGKRLGVKRCESKTCKVLSSKITNQSQGRACVQGIKKKFNETFGQNTLSRALNKVYTQSQSTHIKVKTVKSQVDFYKNTHTHTNTK